MFNKILFNKTLFSRLTALFTSSFDLLLFGERVGFEYITGLVEPFLEREGITLENIEQLGRLFYEITKSGEAILYYVIHENDIREIAFEENAEKVINLVGKVIKDGKS